MLMRGRGQARRMCSVPRALSLRAGSDVRARRRRHAARSPHRSLPPAFRGSARPGPARPQIGPAGEPPGHRGERRGLRRYVRLLPRPRRLGARAPQRLQETGVNRARGPPPRRDQPLRAQPAPGPPAGTTGERRPRADGTLSLRPTPIKAAHSASASPALCRVPPHGNGAL